jgi:hypothetical protein
MHLLVIVVLVCLIFPAFGRLLGSMISAIFWLIVVLVVLAMVGAFSN